MVRKSRKEQERRTHGVDRRSRTAQRVVVLDPLLLDVDRRADPVTPAEVDRDDDDVLCEGVELQLNEKFELAMG